MKENNEPPKESRTVRVIKTILQIIGLVIDLITLRKKTKK